MSFRRRHGNQTGLESWTSSRDNVDTAGLSQTGHQQPSSVAAAAPSNGTSTDSQATVALVGAGSGTASTWLQRWRWRQRQEQQQSPLLSWRLTFRHPGVEFSYWQQRCEQQLLLLDQLVLFVNLMVLLHSASSRSGGSDVAQHAVSLLLLVVQGAVMASGADRYVRCRAMLLLLQRLWRRARPLQQLQLTTLVALATAAAGGAGAAAALVPATCAAGQKAPQAAAAAAAAAALKQDTGLVSSSPWHVLFDISFVASGVAPAWASTWAYQTPFGTALLLQLCFSLLVVLADAGRLLQLLAAPQLQRCIAASYNAASTLSNLLLLPLLPLASSPIAGACPAVPAVPLLLWLQLFWGVAAPLYVLYCCERSSKVWFWLQRLAAMPSVPDDVANEAQGLLREVYPRYAVLRCTVLLLLLLAALSWQACELAYWYLPDSVLQLLLRMQQ